MNASMEMEVIMDNNVNRETSGVSFISPLAATIHVLRLTFHEKISA